MIWLFLFVFLLAAGVIGLSWGYLREQEEISSRVYFIPTAVHGALDYLMGGVLITLPWLMGFAAGGAETWVPVVLGSGVILYSLCTDYEWGLVRRLPMSLHLVLDGVGGLMLFASPLLFGFYDEVLNPHLGFGLLELGIALFTRTGSSLEEASS